MIGKWSFPVLLKFQILPESSPYILAGSELSIVLSHKSRTILQGIKELKKDERERVKAFDLALVIDVRNVVGSHPARATMLVREGLFEAHWLA